MAFGSELRLTFSEQFVGPAHFLDARNHRIHQTHFPVGARPQDSAKLGFEDVHPLQAKTNGAPPQKGIQFLRQVHGGHDFVAPHIEGAYDHRCWSEVCGYASIGFELRFLRGQFFRIKVEKLRAEESHADGSGFEHVFDVTRHFYVCGKLYMFSVNGFTFSLTQGHEISLHLTFLAFEFGVFFKGGLAGVEDGESVVAVQQQAVAGAHGKAEVVQGDHRRDVERARHDGGVRSAAAHVGREAQDGVAIELRGIAGGKIVGD